MINLDNDRLVTLYSFDFDGAYFDKFEYFWANGTGFAANSTNVKPPSFSAGYIPVWGEGKWKILEDHRSRIVYSIETQDKIKVDYVGKIKEGFTELKPITSFDVWNGEKWIDPRTDEEKLTYKRSQYPSLNRYQFKRCLLESGVKSEDIELKILSIDDEIIRELTLLGFQESDNFKRLDQTVLELQKLFDATDETVDKLWEYALTL